MGSILLSQYPLNGVVGEQEVVAGALERLVGTGTDPERRPFPPREGANRRPDVALQFSSRARGFSAERLWGEVRGELGGGR